MGEAALPSVVTAIRGAELEGFVAGTLFNQGWSVTFRALDFQSLLLHIQSSQIKKMVVLLSTDLEGISVEGLETLRSTGVKYFLFATTMDAQSIFPEAIATPTTALELLGIIRGSLRNPLIRPVTNQKLRAQIIGISAASHTVGCTTLALNFASELSEKGKKVLLVDAHSFSPAVALKLGQRGLNSAVETRNISTQLWALEITRPEINQQIATLETARSEFDFIVIDLGVLRDFTASLTGRRWCSEVLVWVSNYADELWVLAKTDLLGTEQLRLVTAELAHNSIKPHLVFLHALRAPAKRSKVSEESFLNLVTPLRPLRIHEYIWDPRSVHSAEEERASLMETNERGALRRSIADIAGEVIS